MPHKRKITKGNRPEQKKEIRSTIQDSRLEVREQQDGTKRLTGYAVVFNSPAQIADFTEYVAPGSFTKTLQAEDQVMLRDHRSELLLGRRSAGTLTLRQDEKGVAFDLLVPNTALGQDTYENTRLGNLKGCSFGFVVRDDTWKQDAAGNLTRVINDVQCFELTLTAFPAYDSTSVDVRSVRAKLKRVDWADDDGDLDESGEDGEDLDECDNGDDTEDDISEDGDEDFDEESEDYRCQYRCTACRSAELTHLSNIAEDNPAVRSKRSATASLSAEDLVREQARCAYRCAACRSLLSCHFPMPNDEDQDTRAAHAALLLRRLR